MNDLSTFNSLYLDGDDQRRTQTRMQISIDKSYRQEPLLSHLIKEFDLTVNISAALLPTNTQEDGWFNLELQGTVAQIRSAIAYLNDHNVQIWRQVDINDSW